GLATLPHVGVVAGSDDTEQLERLLTRLADEVKRRRRTMSERGAATVAELGADAPPALVLLVDDWSGVIEGDGAAQTSFHELLSGGATSAGLTVCLAGDERLLRGRVLNRIDHRFSLRLNSPADATALGLGVRNLPDGLPDGWLLAAADGTEVQVPLLAADTEGTAQATALRELGAALRARFGDPDGPRAPMRLQPLPTRIGLGAATALPRSHNGDVLLGVTGDRHVGVWAALGDATGHLLVAGPNRSGRSTALASVAASGAQAGHDVVLVAPRTGEPHRRAEALGARLTTPDELAEVLSAARPGLVVIDDADLTRFDDDVVLALTGQGGPPLAVAALIDSFGFGARGLVDAAKKAAGPVVLLSPPNHLLAEYVGIRIDRGAAFSGPPGRAFVSVGGELLLCQVPDLTVD
ncbi:MAG: hypothetical protein L0H84_18375, partial [Pseudonocardia sp.]|nr:hypothetical protein [Pseudonocardia sp.]